MGSESFSSGYMTGKREGEVEIRPSHAWAINHAILSIPPLKRNGSGAEFRVQVLSVSVSGCHCLVHLGPHHLFVSPLNWSPSLGLLLLAAHYPHPH